jgi:hypothetical protein
MILGDRAFSLSKKQYRDREMITILKQLLGGIGLQ